MNAAKTHAQTKPLKWLFAGQNIADGSKFDASIIAWILGYNGVYAYAAVR